MAQRYRYRPALFYLLVFVLTWSFWFAAIFTANGRAALPLMFLGLCVPAVTAVCFVIFSGSRALRADLWRKLLQAACIHPGNLLAAVALFAAIVVVSILVSLLVGQPISQFSLTADFSFSVGGSSALLTILLAAVIEELGWRGYGEDAIAQYHSWVKESILFGLIWSAWHLPLFWVPGTYHAGLRALGPLYALNFLVSVVPLGFITTWVYVKNGRSMLACIIFHLFVNFFQEKIAMTPLTKCVETVVITAAAVAIVLCNRDLFFERRHIGKLPDMGSV